MRHWSLDSQKINAQTSPSEFKHRKTSVGLGAPTYGVGGDAARVGGAAREPVRGLGELLHEEVAEDGLEARARRRKRGVLLLLRLGLHLILRMNS